jgi:hypothetical protein
LFSTSIFIYQFSLYPTPLLYLHLLHIPNVAVQWLTLPLRIREVPDSNLGPETGYHDRGISCVSSVPPGKCQDSTLNKAMTASFQIPSN